MIWDENVSRGILRVFLCFTGWGDNCACSLFSIHAATRVCRNFTTSSICITTLVRKRSTFTKKRLINHVTSVWSEILVRVVARFRSFYSRTFLTTVLCSKYISILVNFYHQWWPIFVLGYLMMHYKLATLLQLTVLVFQDHRLLSMFYVVLLLLLCSPRLAN